MELLVDFAAQLRCGAKINMRGTDIDVPHVGGQRGEPGVDILTVPIPGQQPMHGEGVSQIMDARAAVPVTRNAAVL